MSFLTFGRLRRFGAVDRALLLLSVICSLVYLVTQSFQPFPGSVLLKVLSVAPLALIAFRAMLGASAKPLGLEWPRDRDNVILGTALAFSSLGDALLDLDPERLLCKGSWPSSWLTSFTSCSSFATGFGP